ncbi:hypothetical protein IEQ34_016759 [Dendrobium chrysotoxum]|uniref:Uncharacterized protein n=1 Tax=Dendrobium chrysotoxum TaxID=161865 RepID=A0AAV7GGG4_DENCH|nr:hypothetical protein IEQ34_016759 [Dendrobium chrysotoxum]
MSSRHHSASLGIVRVNKKEGKSRREQNLLEKISGIIPISLIPNNWNESLLISASNNPIFDIAAAACIHHLNHSPPISNPTCAKYPSLHSPALELSIAPVPASRGTKYDATTSPTAPKIALGNARLGSSTSPASALALSQ